MNIGNETNNLEKIKLSANILFSGIGCQEIGFRNSNLFDIEVLVTSDISKEATLSYAAVHCGLTNEMIDTYQSYPSREEMAQYLTDINLGYNPDAKEEKGERKEYNWFKLIKRKNKSLEKYWLAAKLSNNMGDISKIEELPCADIWSISFPCTDISIAGKMKGLKPDSGTRSSLLWDNIKLLNKAKEKGELPKYVMFENVKSLVNKSFINDFNELINVMGELGFNTYWKVLNGKDCGIPQNRERVFVICIRKDIDIKLFDFPIPFDNGLRLNNMLENEVDDKYYLSETAVRKFTIFDETKDSNIKIARSLNLNKNIQNRVRALDINSVSQSLTATDYKDPVKILVGIDKSIKNPKVLKYANCITAREDRGISNYESVGIAIIETDRLKQVGQIYGTDKEPNPQAGRIYDSNYISPTLDTCSGGNRMPKIIQLGQVSNDGSQAGKVYSPEGISQTICACTHGYAIGNIWDYIRIRKLTPRETWKLMGLTFEDCDRATAIGTADTHLYKQAGNGIITNCVELIAEHLYKAQYDNTYVCTDEKYTGNFTHPQEE